ncbi:unnamed protein product [Prunus armeniaca]
MEVEAEAQVVIVGAGIAGLATSLGLHRFSLSLSLSPSLICAIHYDSKQQAKFKFFWLQAWHIRSLVLESSDSLRTTGFAFSAWTNAWKALDALGIGDTLRRQHETLHGYIIMSPFWTI